MTAPNFFRTELLRGNIDLTTITIKAALGGTGTAYTFDPTAHTYVNDVFDGGTTAEELDYISPDDRKVLANQSVSQDDTDNEGVFDADNVTWAGLSTTQDIQFAMLYQQVGGDDTTPGDDPIISIWDDDSAGSLADLPLTTDGSDVTLNFSSEGIINIP